jgi:hypothetical protein
MGIRITKAITTTKAHDTSFPFRFGMVLVTIPLEIELTALHISSGMFVPIRTTELLPLNLSSMALVPVTL